MTDRRGVESGPAAVAAELVEVVDAAGVVQEVVTRAEMRRRGLRHRAVCIAVVDPAGEQLLVHRRADWKDVWPSRWDLGFGGVVGVGEDWLVAARRELAEEAGVSADLVHLGSGTFEDGEVAEVAEVYLARCAGPFSFPDGEVAEVAWVRIRALEGWLAGRSCCPDSVAILPPLLRRALGSA